MWVTHLDSCNRYATIRSSLSHTHLNCLIYARVSTERQADKDLSIPAQLQAMREHAKRQGWSVTQEFIEPGASAWHGERPTFKALLERCRQEPRVEVVLIHKIDRFARNLMEHLTFRALLRQHNVRLASVVENIDESAAGLLLENIMAAMAEHYSRNLSEEAKKGMRQKVERGGWPHKPPLGYQAVRDSEGRSKIEPHPLTGPLMRQAFEFYASGFYSIKQLAAELAPKGLVTRLAKPLPQSHLNALLRNPFYLGRIRWKGEVHPGAHEALVTHEVFVQVQRQLSARSLRGNSRYGGLEFWLKGIAFCGACGARMTAERHRRHAYYRCLANARSRQLCSAPFSNAVAVHDKLRAAYKTLVIAGAAKDCLLQAVATHIRERLADTVYRQRESLVMTRTRLLERQVKAAETYAAGEMPRETYVALMERMSRELVGLDDQLRAISVDPEAAMATAGARVRSARSLWDLHISLSIAERARLAHAVFDRIDVRAGAIEHLRIRGSFANLFEQSQGGTSAVVGELDDAALQLANIVGGAPLTPDGPVPRRGRRAGLAYG